MVIGAQKCGTTTLYDLLGSHPRIVGSQPKEPHFFSTSPDWRKGLQDYRKIFPRADGALYFEASTSYTFYPLRNLEIWADLYALNPRLKLIYIVRNPIDRIVSNYMHMYQRGYTDRTLEEELTGTPLYMDVSRYATQITPFIKQFGRQRVQILFFEDLVERPDRVVEALARFLGVSVDGFANPETVHSNRSVGAVRIHAGLDNPLMWRFKRLAPRLWRLIVGKRAKRMEERPRMSPERQRAVIRLLSSEIDALEALTGRNLTGWRTVRTD